MASVIAPLVQPFTPTARALYLEHRMLPTAPPGLRRSPESPARIMTRGAIPACAVEAEGYTLDLIRFHGHFPKGGYDVHDATITEGPAAPTARTPEGPGVTFQHVVHSTLTGETDECGLQNRPCAKPWTPSEHALVSPEAQP